MRVIVTQIAASTHLYRMAPLAWALKTAGHEVVVAAPPDFLGAVERTGLSAVAVGRASRLAERLAATPIETTVYGSGFDLAEDRPEILTYQYVRGCLAAFASSTGWDFPVDDSMYDDLVAFSRDWRPDLVLWDANTFAGPVAARASGAAHVRVTLGRDHWARMRELYLDMRRDLRQNDDDPVEEWMSERLGRYGCEFTEDAVFGQRTVDWMPSWLRLPVRHEYLPVRHVPHNSPKAIAPWLSARRKQRPRACVSMGYTMREMFGGRMTFDPSMLFEAVHDLDLDVVALLDPIALPDAPKVPANVRIAGYVPLGYLLDSCDAIIHHGGPGTTADAIVKAVPQILVPDPLYDIHRIGPDVAAQGLGFHLPAGDASAALLRSALKGLIGDPQYAERAEAARREALSAPTPNDLVGHLESLASMT
ncbi:L-2-deoxyfucosyltransferase [Murinocardiopsis flavida]|uniref:L-2-deoxyfucosyltransferase n=1 Tax=Murinocardiopsis flavida TaxID=645275 RepID=A0A2P8DKV4_9ACTN|nr:nucleotide disphospho-sugar-binding domain-containing protein [Murinocardiopsis flavida]PSK97843.1 L-2-deoxyfucosyltransferase [Murinocardiopsis flavida]